MISAEEQLRFSDDSSIRFLNQVEASGLSETIRKRNVFARHSHENSFYIQRINELSNHTVIEVFRPGDPQAIREEVERIASLLERIVLLSSVLIVRKSEFLRNLGISSKPRNELDLIIGSQIQYISSKSRSVYTPSGIRISEKFQKRFLRCGFDKLYDFSLDKNKLSKRVASSIEWLFESRREPSTPASFVKTSIALESLLIFSDSEPLARSLSERVAYILSPEPNVRQQLSSIMVDFYNARSGIVHGSAKRMDSMNVLLLEAVDRICVLIYLIIAANTELWPSIEEFRRWFETQRWGYSGKEPSVPYPMMFLRNTLNLIYKK
jgi:hypothetical protein